MEPTGTPGSTEDRRSRTATTAAAGVPESMGPSPGTRTPAGQPATPTTVVQGIVYAVLFLLRNADAKAHIDVELWRKPVLDTVPKKFEDKWGKGVFEALLAL